MSFYTSKPPAGIGVKRNDLRPWRALAPTRLSWRDPSCGNRWLPGATPPAAPPAPPPPLLSSPGRAVISSSGHLCGPRRLPNVSQTSPTPLPDGSRTSHRRLPNSSQPSPSRLPDGSQRRGVAPEGSKWPQKCKNRHFSVLGEKESQKSKNEHISQFGTPKWAIWAHFRILAPKVRKKVPETNCLINILGPGAK